jgi:hypothetical protein
LLVCASHLDALELAMEPDVDVKVASILVEVEESPGPPREGAALSLSQLGNPAQACKQGLQPLKVLRRCMTHAPRMASKARTTQAGEGNRRREVARMRLWPADLPALGRLGPASAAEYAVRVGAPAWQPAIV